MILSRSDWTADIAELPKNLGNQSLDHLQDRFHLASLSFGQKPSTQATDSKLGRRELQEPGRPSKIHSLPAFRVQTTTEYVVHRTENGRGGTGTVQNLWNPCGVWQRQTLRRYLDRHQ